MSEGLIGAPELEYLPTMPEKLLTTKRFARVGVGKEQSASATATNMVENAQRSGLGSEGIFVHGLRSLMNGGWY